MREKVIEIIQTKYFQSVDTLGVKERVGWVQKLKTMGQDMIFCLLGRCSSVDLSR